MPSATSSPDLRSDLELVDRIIATELPKMEGWCDVEKGQRMARLIADIGPGVRAVELGVFGARSLVCLGLAVRHCLNSQGTVDGIDPYSPAASCEGSSDRANSGWWAQVDYPTILRGARAAIIRLDLDAIITLKLQRSQDVVHTYADASIDILHLDANHSPEASCWDVATWAPKMKAGGTWVFDDTNWPTTKVAQQRLASDHGFVLLEPHDNWAIYRAP